MVVFKIRVISDLHLEYRNYIPKHIFPTPQHRNSNEVEEILVLAGDIGDPYSQIYKDFLIMCRSLFEMVLVVAGNHEFLNKKVEFKNKRNSRDSIDRTIQPTNYQYVKCEARTKMYSYDEVVQHIKNICDELGCVFLNNSAVVYKGVKFIGSPLWSNIKRENFPYIRERNYGIFRWMYVNGSLITMDEYNKFNKEAFDYLQTEIRDSFEKSVVIITHYPPTDKMLNPIYERQNPMNDMYYCRNGEELLFPNVKLWVSGHTHQPGGVVINRVPIVSNAIGDAKDYRKTFGFSKEFGYVIND
jgi:predicted phosphodiesterase